MRRQTWELWVGLFIVAGLLSIVMLSFKVANLGAVSGPDGYQIKARFENIGQLKVKAPVTLAGVRIGRVTQISIDPDYFAVATLDIDRRHDNLPADTSAAIFTSGLLGEQYIALEPGGDETFLKNGDQLPITQSALVLEKLIGQFLYRSASESNNLEQAIEKLATAIKKN